MSETEIDWRVGISWQCMVCGDVRPDAAISVYSEDRTPPSLPPDTVRVNVRYCNDRPECHERAPKWGESFPRRPGE